MMKNERERKSSPYSLEKKKTKKANKTIKRLEPNKTVLDRWLKEQSEPEVKGRKSARESGSSKLLVRKDVKQINDSQENSLGDLNPKVRRHSYQKQNESERLHPGGRYGLQSGCRWCDQGMEIIGPDQRGLRHSR